MTKTHLFAVRWLSTLSTACNLLMWFEESVATILIQLHWQIKHIDMMRLTCSSRSHQMTEKYCSTLRGSFFFPSSYDIRFFFVVKFAIACVVLNLMQTNTTSSTIRTFNIYT